MTHRVLLLKPVWQFPCDEMPLHDHATVPQTADGTPPPDDTAPFADPIDGIRTWLDDAAKSEINDPNAMALATVDHSGMPDVRMVLLKGIDNNGLEFYTNSHSKKGSDLAHNPKAAVLFHWKSMRMQIRVRGNVSKIDNTTNDAYFASRVRGSQIAATASSQSQPIASIGDLQNRYRQLSQQYENTPVPRPPHWLGYRIVPEHIEFWTDGPYRMHRRWHYHRAEISGAWKVRQLQP